ncbi:hypothetical protein HanPI659440_Chr13g0483531 [Helianthus annuus]|nr:hypothetical protein HanPI659440_Chr13g0483531 [Helianthus annuus]
MFNVFYYVSYTEGFYSFNSRTAGVLPCSRDPPKSFHDWKQKFFYIRRGVIPIDMHYRSKSDGVPKMAVSISFTDEEWYKTLTRRPTPIIQLEEKALVAADMSLLWVPRDPRAYPVYAYKGKAGYSLINVFDPKVAGEMAMATFPVGEPKWAERIRDNFLHPSSESMGAYSNMILGVLEAKTDLDTTPTREEAILLSSEESMSLALGLTHRSSRAGPQQRLGQDSTVGGVSTPPVVDPASIVVGPKQKVVEAEKAEKREARNKKTTDEPARAPTRKRFFNGKLLNYVVVSDSLSGLDARIKRFAPDPDDKATLTEIMAKKQKILADKKRELDEQAALALSEKKLKVMGETVAPSDSEVDLGVFAKKPRNLLEKIFEAFSQPRSMTLGYLSSTQSARAASKGVKIIPPNIADITPPISPPPIWFDESPPRPDPKGKGKEGTVKGAAVKKVTPPVAPGVVIQDEAHAEGVEIDYESSEATPPQGTLYTRRGPSTSGGRDPSVSRQGPEFEKVRSGGSWMAHNPSCDDLPHAPRWNLIQGSRMDSLENCHEFYSLSFPPAERLYQKNRNRFNLLDDHIQSGVNFFSTTQEIVRE